MALATRQLGKNGPQVAALGFGLMVNTNPDFLLEKAEDEDEEVTIF